MTIQIDFTNYELSSQRVARALYESLAVEGGRQVPSLPHAKSVTVSPSTGRGILSTDNLSQDAFRMKRLAAMLTRFPLKLKNKYTISPYYIVPRYTVPSKLIATVEDSDHSVFQAEGPDGVVRRLRIRRMEIETVDAGKEYIDHNGIDIPVPVNTAQPFGYTDPWPIGVTLTPPEWFISDVKMVKRVYYNRSYEPVEGDSVKGLRDNALCGPREAILALHNRLSEEAKKAIDKYLSALMASIGIDNNSAFYTTDNTLIKLQSITGSAVVVPASLSLEGARVTLDVYYAKNKYVVKTNADVQHLVPLECARRNAATPRLAIVEEILRQFFTKYAPDVPKEKATELIDKSVRVLQILELPEVITTVQTVKNASLNMDPRLRMGHALDLTKLTKATRSIANKVEEELNKAGLVEILRAVDKEPKENLIALIVFAITTRYYAGASLWNYFVRAIEEEEPVTGHKQWKYAIGMDKIPAHAAPVIVHWFTIGDQLFKSVNMVFEDVDSGEEVILVPVPSRPNAIRTSRYHIRTSTAFAAGGAKIEGSVILPARCVEYLEHSDFTYSYVYTPSTVVRIDEPTEERPVYTYGDNVYKTEGGTGRNHLIHTSEILST